MENTNWDDLLKNIREQRAVLLLGHNFLPGTRDQLNATFSEKTDVDLQHYYMRDGLFLFRDSESKTNAQEVASGFYQNHPPKEEMLRKIVEMPFRLMVSSNPDKFLVDEFARYRQNLQFDYFSSNNKEHEYELERPSIENPLLYNVCGSVEDPESLILDYDDLYKMLRDLLTDLKVPNEIRLPLQKTTTYFFLGFHFERWYTQLLLRYLNMADDQFTNRSRNYVLNTTFMDPEMERFFLQQFNIKYIGADWSFFEELHRRFSEKYPEHLRKLVDELSPTATTISQLVAKGEFGTAFTLLNSFSEQLDSDDQMLLTVTQSAYSAYLEHKKDGTVEKHLLDNELARVRKNILELSKTLS